jgi:CRISPR-associated endonuclease/helicase Cas3
MVNETISFGDAFEKLTENKPFPWQMELYDRFLGGGDSIPTRCDIPTGLGKTSVIAIWLLAREVCPLIPRRLAYVVNRRTVVDQTTDEIERIRENLAKVGKTKNDLAISTLRGQYADNREWSADPSKPAVICGTVDMIGSRLLFSGYGVGFKGRPLHAGFLGQDSLIVHDEAHLEPAFQDLLLCIQREQCKSRFPDFKPMRVMELSATSRSENNDKPFELTQAEKDATKDSPGVLGIVGSRIRAPKQLHLHEQSTAKLGEQLAKIAIDRFKDSGRAILIFTRMIDDVKAIVNALDKAKLPASQLIGPMRGLERNRLIDPCDPEGSPIFARFLLPPRSDAPAQDQWKVIPTEGTVFLVCTSAGEVGVNISADHLVCDLSTFESMAQRFGRVNRFGLRDDTQIHVVHPTEFVDKAPDPQREKTLALLKKLNGNASPDALSRLDAKARADAFAPLPTILSTTDILFDAWSMTSIRDKMPGRPPVEPYLHGIRDYEPPETQVAWREEVSVIIGDLLGECPPEDLLDEYPLKPHELLGDRSDRVHKELVELAERFPGVPAWVIDEWGKVMPTLLGRLAEKPGRGLIENKTVLLPHDVGGLTTQGLLNGSQPLAAKTNDVADALVNEQKLPIRLRVWDDDPDFDTKAEGMRLILRIDFPPSEENEDEKQSSWHWFERPIPKENSKNAKEPVLLDDHVTDVVRNLVDEKEKGILSRLTLDLDPERDAMFKKAILVAAKFHDLGKKRELWQRSIGRPARLAHLWFGKSGRRWRPRDIAEYRHEFGSLVDLQNEEAFKSLDDESKDLVQHLIATHHGQGRPHFTSAQTVDPNSTTPVCDAIAIEVPRRYARLQRKFGRWGLAYIESLLRAADYAASAAPSAFFTEEAK